MTRLKRESAVAALLAATLLAGCSGGGGGASYDRYDQRYSGMMGAHDLQTFTDPATLPNSGGGQYSGVARMSAENQDIMGRMRLDFRFGSSGDPVSGSIDQFRNMENTALGGRFTISDGRILRDVNPYYYDTYSAQLTGSIMLPENTAADVTDAAAPGAPQAEYVLSNGYLRGNFLGHGDAVAGDIRGSLYAEGPGNSATLDGNYIAER